ncbi:MAG: hypothetical protein INQ03_05685 [Candidatus Heimdallarchaeota archaeon]|nr:hypothetical protein [Candidatus Heimdallarchaeota archaeon]
MTSSSRNILIVLFLIYLPCFILFGILVWLAEGVPALILLSVVIAGVFFLTLGYIHNEVKYEQSKMFYLLPWVTFIPYIYFKQNLYDLIYYIGMAVFIFMLFVLNGNMRSKTLYLGYTYSPQELLKIRSGTIERVKAMGFDEQMLIQTIAEFNRFNRDILFKENYLHNPPEVGSAVISPKNISEDGKQLLQKAKDTLFLLLYGNEDLNVHLERVESELLSITMSRLKAFVLQPYFQAVTETAVRGTWFDPENVATDIATDNVILEVEYGEVITELIGNAIKSCLRIINYLEINEQVLYLRFIDLEQSTLK